MVQRIDFSQLTNLGAVADPVLAQDAASKNYVDSRGTGSINLDTIGSTFVNVIVGTHAVECLSNIAGVTTTINLSDEGTGDGAAIKAFFDQNGTTIQYRFVGDTNVFTVASTALRDANSVTITLGASVNFLNNIPGLTNLQVQQRTATPFTDIILNSPLSGSVATGPTGRQTLTLNSSGGGGGTPGGQNTQIQFNNNGAFGGTASLTWNGTQLGVNIVSSAVAQALSLRSDTGVRISDNNANFLSLNGNSAGNSPVISTAGSDANINLVVYGKGTGGVQIGTLANATPLITANAAAPTALTPGTAGQVLTSAGAAKSPYWATASGGITSLPFDVISWVSVTGVEYVSSKDVTPVVADIQALSSLSAVWEFTGTVSLTGFTSGSEVVGTDSVGRTVSGVYAPGTGGTNYATLTSVNYERSAGFVVATTYSMNWRQGKFAAAAIYVGDTAGGAQLASELGGTTSLSFGLDSQNPGRYLLTVPPAYVSGIADTQIATRIGSAPSTTTYISSGAQTVGNGFGNAGTTATFISTSYTTAKTFLESAAIGAIPVVGGVGNWTLPTWPIRISNITNPSSTQFGTVTQIQESSTTQFLSMTISGNAAYFAGLTTQQTLFFLGDPSFVFQANVVQAIDRITVASLNTLQGPLSLSAGPGIGITTGTNAITVSNTGLGISASNTETYNSTQSRRIPLYTFLNGDGTQQGTSGFVGMPLADINSLYTSGGVLNGVRYVSSGITTAQRGISFPTSATPLAQFRLAFTFPAFTVDLTFSANTAAGADARNGDAVIAFCYFARAGLTSGQNPSLNSNLMPLFDNGQGPTFVGSNLAPFKPPSVISRTAQGTGTAVSATFRYVFSDSEWRATANSANWVGSTQEYIPYLEIDEILAAEWVSAISYVSVGLAGYPSSGGVEVLFGITGSGGATPSLQQIANVGNTLTNTSGNVGSILVTDSVTSESTTLTGTKVQGYSLVLNGATSGAATLKANATTSAYQLLLPAAQGLANQTLVNDGSGNLSWGASSSSSSLQQVVNIGNAITNSGSNVGVITLTDSVSTKVTTLDGTKVETQVLRLDGSTSGNLQVKTAATTTSYVLTLPASQGVANQSLLNDGSGNLSWGLFNLQAVLNLGNSATSTASNVSTILLTDNASSKTTTLSGTKVESQSLVLDGSTSGNTTIKAAPTTTTYQLVLPAAQGTSNQTLFNDGSGNLTWGTVAANPPIWLTGTGAPLDALGVIGNYYQDTSVTFPGNHIWLKTQTTTSPYWIRQPNLENAILSYNGGQLFFSFARVVATSNITLSGLQTIDGIALAAGDIVLAIAQTPGTASGLYTVGSGGWVRTSTAIVQGLVVIISLGTSNAGNSYIETLPIVTVGTSQQSWTLFANNGATSLQAVCAVGSTTTSNVSIGGTLTVGYTPDSTTNTVSLFGAATGANANIVAAGVDTNVGLTLAGKGTGRINVNSGADLKLGANIGNSSANYVTVSGNAIGSSPTIVSDGNDTNVGLTISTKGTGRLSVTSGADLRAGANIGNASANFITLSGTTTTNPPTLVSDGSDTNVGLVISGKGAGRISVNSGTDLRLGVTIGINSTNWLSFSGTASGFGPTISAAGSDANVDLRLIALGTGTVTASPSFASSAGVLAGNTFANKLTMAGSGTGVATSLTASGSDANVAINITAKGLNGVINLQNGGTGYAQITGNNSTSPVQIGVAGNTNQSILLSPAGIGSTFLGNAVTNSGIIITGGQTTVSEIVANASAADVNLNLKSKGAGIVYIASTDGTRPALTIDGTTSLFQLSASSTSANLDFQIRAQGAGGIILGDNVTYTGIKVTGQNNTFAEIIPTGNPLNIDLALSTFGTGSVLIGGQTTSTRPILVVNQTSATQLVLSISGTPANADFVITPKGTGDFYPIGNSLSATTTNQPAIYVASARGSTTLGVGTQGQVLTSNGTGGAPYWAAGGGLQSGNMSVYTFAASPTGASAAALTLTNQINNLSLTLSTNSLTGFVANATYMIFMSFSWNGQNAAVNAFTSLSTTANIVTTIGYGAGVSVSNIRTAATPTGDTTTVSNIGYYVPGATPATLYAYYFVGGSGTITNSTVTILRIA